jgi:hypothetical protein
VRVEEGGRREGRTYSGQVVELKRKMNLSLKIQDINMTVKT